MGLIKDTRQCRPGVQAVAWLLVGVVAALTLNLWPQWVSQPDLSHGFFMPVLFFYLIVEGRTNGARRYLSPTWPLTLIQVLLIISAVLLLIAAGLYAAAVGWAHALVAFSLTSVGVMLLAAGLIVLADERIRLLPCNWPVLTAIGLWLLCAPLPPGTYSRLTLFLQLGVSEHVVSALHWLGIPAIRHGNIIDLPTTSVGVAEACSGVRSLLSCIFAGFLFSATLVQRFWPRILLIALSAPLALVMNFLRSLLLTLLANAGINIEGPWHDGTGYAVLAITAAILGGMALLLEGKPSALPAPKPSLLTKTSGRARSLLVALGLCSCITLFFYINTRPIPPSDRRAPDLTALLPHEYPGWQSRTDTNIYQFSGILKTDDLIQRSYFKRQGPDRVQLTVYIAYWTPGQSTVSDVAMHTPDACWPGAGWKALPSNHTREALSLGNRELPLAEERKFISNGYPQYVWFWHFYEGRPVGLENPRSAIRLVKHAFTHGFTRDGYQIFVRVSSNKPWFAISGEPLLKHIFDNLKPYGF